MNIGKVNRAKQKSTEYLINKYRSSRRFGLLIDKKGFTLSIDNESSLFANLIDEKLFLKNIVYSCTNCINIPVRTPTTLPALPSLPLARSEILCDAALTLLRP